jgi:uncharacterized protein YhfF
MHDRIVPASLDQSLHTFWNAFVATVGGVDSRLFYESFSFGDSEALANELAALVLRNTKQATASAKWCYESEGKALPAPGGLSIVTDWASIPLCVIETLSVEVHAFNQVSADFAAAEGEGDGSLDYWRAAHRDFFTRECVAAGRQFAEDMLIVCERFRCIYRPA